MNARVVRVAVSTKISARVSTPCWEMGSLMGRPLPVLVDADDALGGPLSLDGREENNLRVGRDGAVDNRRVSPGKGGHGAFTVQLEHASVPVACLEVSDLDDLE